MLCRAVLCAAAAETQDAENTQACLLVTLVVLAKGKVSMPQEPLRGLQSFKESIKSVSRVVSVGGRARGGGGDAA